jgi:hypothetical protein
MKGISFLFAFFCSKKHKYEEANFSNKTDAFLVEKY